MIYYPDNIIMLFSWNEYVDRYGHGQVLGKIGILYKPWQGQTGVGLGWGMRRNQGSLNLASLFTFTSWQRSRSEEIRKAYAWLLLLRRVSISKVCISKEIRKAYAWLPGVGSGMRAAAACDQKAHTNENYRTTREAKYVTQNNAKNKLIRNTNID